MGLFCTSMCSAHVLHGSPTFYNIVVWNILIFHIQRSHIANDRNTILLKYYIEQNAVFVFSFFGGIKLQTTQIIFNAGSTNEFTNRKSPKYTMTTTTIRPSLPGLLPPLFCSHPFSLSVYIYVLNRITFILRFFLPKIKGQRRWLCVHVWCIVYSYERACLCAYTYICIYNVIKRENTVLLRRVGSALSSILVAKSIIVYSSE